MLRLQQVSNETFVIFRGDINILFIFERQTYNPHENVTINLLSLHFFKRAFCSNDGYV